MPLFLPAGAVATTPQEMASVWRHQFTKDFDHRLREIRTQVRKCDTSEGTLVTPACEKTQKDEAACDPVAQVEPCFSDWVDEHKSQVPHVLARHSV